MNYAEALKAKLAKTPVFIHGQRGIILDCTKEGHRHGSSDPYVQVQLDDDLGVVWHRAACASLVNEDGEVADGPGVRFAQESEAALARKAEVVAAVPAAHELLRQLPRLKIAAPEGLAGINILDQPDGRRELLLHIKGLEMPEAQMPPALRALVSLLEVDVLHLVHADVVQGTVIICGVNENPSEVQFINAFDMRMVEVVDE